MNAKQVDKVIRSFDFQAMHQVMLAMKWHWGVGPNSYIPSVEDLRATARKLVASLHPEKCKSISTGGFEARLHFDEGKACGATLDFVALSSEINL